MTRPILTLLLTVTTVPLHVLTDLVFLGSLSELAHSVKGNLSAMTQSELLLTSFYYDGKAPDAFFIVGTSGNPGDESGTIIPFPDNGKAYTFHDQEAPRVTEAFENEDLLLKLPPNMKVRDVSWFSMYCRKYKHNFGEVRMSKDLDLSGLEEDSGDTVRDDKETSHIDYEKSLLSSFSNPYSLNHPYSVHFPNSLPFLPPPLSNSLYHPNSPIFPFPHLPPHPYSLSLPLHHPGPFF